MRVAVWVVSTVKTPEGPQNGTDSFVRLPSVHAHRVERLRAADSARWQYAIVDACGGAIRRDAAQHQQQSSDCWLVEADVRVGVCVRARSSARLPHALSALGKGDCGSPTCSNANAAWQQ